MNNTFTKEDTLNLYYLLTKALRTNILNKKTYNHAINELKDYQESEKQITLTQGLALKEQE